MPQKKIKFLIDENLSQRLVAVLNEAFEGNNSHVSIENLLNSTDKQIWEFAKTKNYCILTKDWDYSFMSAAYGCPPKVIRLNCGNKTTTFIAAILKNKFIIIQEFLVDEDLCYLEIE